MKSHFTSLAGLAIALALVAGLPGLSTAQDATPEPEIAAAVIDYDGFSALVEDVAPYRAKRLIGIDTFNEMAGEPGTIILDTRSAEAFAEGHIAGAIHLNFSEFTDEKLAKVIPSPETRILIYCNNNFVDDVAPVMLKRAPLALNVPTFVNLYGYGYTNVYELADLVSMEDPRVNWSRGEPAL